jgi:hypothetical protein
VKLSTKSVEHQSSDKSSREFLLVMFGLLIAFVYFVEYLNRRGAAERTRVDKKGAALLKRLLDAGLSRYEPTPLEAPERAERLAAAK